MIANNQANLASVDCKYIKLKGYEECEYGVYMVSYLDYKKMRQSDDPILSAMMEKYRTTIFKVTLSGMSLATTIPAADRNSVSQLTDDDIFDLLSVDDAEVSKRTFDLLVFSSRGMLSKINGSIYQYLQKVDPRKESRSRFLEYALENNFVGKMLDGLTDQEKESLVDDLLPLKEDGKIKIGLGAKVIESLVDMDIESVERSFIEKRVLQFYNESLNRNESDNVLMLQSILATYHAQSKVVHEKEIAKIIQDIKVIDSGIITENRLFHEGQSVQVHYFSNDGDGKESYRSFMQHGKVNNFGYTTIDMDSFVVMTKSIGTKTIHMLVTKPEKEADASNDILKYLREEKLTVEIVVHRGHSYHVSGTISKMKRLPGASEIAIVNLGSCTGHRYFDRFKKIAPATDVIMTRSVGSMFVNNPMIYHMNDYLLQNGNFSWDDFWAGEEKYFRTHTEFQALERFKKYINPSGGIAGQIYATYNSLKE
ncbi:MAG: hypothetical protein R3A45_03780 [Bdellovibrionota bacterium]